MLVYDLEIVNAIPPNGRPGSASDLFYDFYDGRLGGISYCGGWEDYGRMGIAVICAYDYGTDAFRVFCNDNLYEFQNLVDGHDVVAGFNIVHFDNRVCRENGIVIGPDRSYDLLCEIWAGLGMGPEFVPDTHCGYGLDACGRANELRLAKNGRGDRAPVMWQCGQIGSVIDYCMRDVWLTKQLIDRVLAEGRLRNPRRPESFINVRKPGGVCDE
ncbi:MAG: hypothetical protein HKM93_10460 [Desulfobacteraceae bacterium]|nr:hypothetical protein [Desulfobacteraceae bacterium]